MDENRIAVWAGAECAFIRVRGEIRDQLVATGHAGRLSDLDRLAELGIEGFRQPILWGWRARAGEPTDLRWADDRMGRLRDLGIAPVVGLLHHGSGPGDRSFLDPDFADAFAGYARTIAERYPWVTDWIPINEPTTTARFTGLYGFWEPHLAGREWFARILLAQCRAIRAAMRAIREVNPAARLIVNEDVGRAEGTPALRERVAFDNERRWGALDLLTGRLAPTDPMWRFLRSVGQEASVIDLVEDPEPPDIIGLDYYVTSDRFLDERVHLYPPGSYDPHGEPPHRDVEAVRAAGASPGGWAARIDEAHQRYGRPMALTEVSLAGATADRCAWWREAWRAARDARDRGIDIRAVTGWAAFGASGWERLLLEPRGRYAPGAFDIRGSRIRWTALARTIQATVAERDGSTARATRRPGRRDRRPAHAGWWHAPDRVIYPAPVQARPTRAADARATERPPVSTRRASGCRPRSSRD